MYARLASIRLPFFAIIHHLGWSVLISPEKYQMCSPIILSQTRTNKERNKILFRVEVVMKQDN